MSNQADCLLTEGAHALLLCQAAQLVLGGPGHYQALDLDPVLMAGVAAEVAASAVAELRLGLTSALLVERGTTMKRRATSSGTKAIASGSGLSLRRSTTGILKTSPSTSTKSR